MSAAVDVLVPAFNAAATIEGALESILGQTRRDLRLLVIDDGSTDDTPRLVERLAAADPRVELVCRPNGGIVDALNDGLARCTAPIVARHDGDDLADPERLARQLDYLASHPGTVAVGGAVRHIDANGRDLGTVARLQSPEGATPLSAPSREPYIVHPFLTVRRDALVRVGGYRHCWHAEDTDLYWRLQEIGQLHNLDDIVGQYRMHAASISSASLVNGRIMAVSSQLAGLAAARRRAGRPDLLFPRDRLAAFKAAGALAPMVAVGADGLDGEEAARLAVMTAGKMMFLASFRPFELELADCRFIRDALDRHAGLLTGENVEFLRRASWSSAARLLRGGHVRAGLALTGKEDARPVAARFAFRAVTTPALRRTLRRWRGGPDYIK